MFIRSHQITEVYHLSSYLPLNTEMLYTWAMLLKNEILAQNLSFLVGGIFLITAVYFFTQKFFSKKLAGLASLIFIFTPLVSWESATPKVELFWTFFVLLGLWAIINWWENQKTQWLFLGGVFLGLSFATKGFLGALPLLSLFPFLILGFFQAKKKMPLIKHFLIFGLLILLLYIPYLVRNFYLTGNPVFPFFTPYYGTGEFNEPAIRLLNFPRHLWKMSMFPHKFGPDIGPFYFTFLPVGIGVFLLGKKRERTQLLALFCILFYFFWALSPVDSTRYLLPLFPLAAIIIANTTLYLIKLSQLTKFLAISVVAITIPMTFLTYFLTFEPYGPKLKAAFGIYDKRTYILRLLPYTEDFFWMNENLPVDAKVLLYLNRWQRPFYLDRPFVLVGRMQTEIDFFPDGKIKTEEDFVEELKTHQVTHIYSREMEPNKEDHARYLMYLMQNPSFGEQRLIKLHKNLPGYGWVYEVVYE